GEGSALRVATEPQPRQRRDEPLRDGSASKRGGSSPHHRDPDLHRSKEAFRILAKRLYHIGAAVARLDQLVEPRLSQGEQRDLRARKNPVAQDQEENDRHLYQSKPPCVETERR